MHASRQKLARVNSHGEGLACKVAQALLCDGLEVGRLIVLWGVLMVGQLHEEVPLWHQQQCCIGARSTNVSSYCMNMQEPDLG